MVTVLFVSFFIMLFISVPIAVALGIGSVLALVLCSHMPLLLLPQKMFNGINTFTYMAIPLFMLAGAVMAEAKISDRVFRCNFGLSAGNNGCYRLDYDSLDEKTWLRWCIFCSGGRFVGSIGVDYSAEFDHGCLWRVFGGVNRDHVLVRDRTGDLNCHCARDGQLLDCPS